MTPTPQENCLLRLVEVNEGGLTCGSAVKSYLAITLRWWAIQPAFYVCLVFVRLERTSSTTIVMLRTWPKRAGVFVASFRPGSYAPFNALSMLRAAGLDPRPA